MTDAEMREYLADNGYPEHVWRDGKAGLLKRWKQFVEQVERGYPFGLEDYRNDLDLRAVLSMVGLDAEVKDLDTRFQALLTARDQRIWESAASGPFWDFGYPRNAAGDLLDDLRAEGLAA